MTPSHASASRKGGGEALTGGVQAVLLSSEITLCGLPTGWSVGEGKTIYRDIASGVWDPRSLRAGHVHKLIVRKPGEPGSGRRCSTVGSVGEGLVSCSQYERTREVGRGNSIYEADEQKCSTE